MQIDFDKLGEKHQDVFENLETQSIANWKQSNFDDVTDEAQYLTVAIKNIKNLKDKINNVLTGIKTE